MSFTIHRGKGFQIEHENGVTVSVMFGTGNYAEHHASRKPYTWELDVLTSKHAEVAVIRRGKTDASDVWYDPDTLERVMSGTEPATDVKGWCDAAYVTDLIARVSKMGADA
jgi:hypothetical protein